MSSQIAFEMAIEKKFYSLMKVILLYLENFMKHWSMVGEYTTIIGCFEISMLEFVFELNGLGKILLL